jgi:hypothetical protein
LHDHLQSHFRGNTTGGIKKAVVRLKTIIDLSTLQLVHLGITSFCHNDQGAASNIHPFLRKGVLVLRDLGYFSLSSLRYG